jgi:hypothetical protein
MHMPIAFNVTSVVGHYMFAFRTVQNIASCMEVVGGALWPAGSLQGLFGRSSLHNLGERHGIVR